MSEIISQIEKRKEKLREVAKELKLHFVGLDNIIDDIIKNITTWYCMNEVLTRPIIICLWGLTGNGKTDLVRRLVKALDFSDKFVEIQMTNKGVSNYNSLQSYLRCSNISNNEPGVLFLDEIQRFRSIDDKGEDIHDYAFQDVWMLLSDGSFGNDFDNKQKVFDMILDHLYAQDYKSSCVKKSEDDDEDDDEDREKNNNNRKYKLSIWQAKQIKSVARLKESVEEIMQWTTEKKFDVLHSKINDKSIYSPEVYSKLLVFISGNLDEAYTMASRTGEVDVDADVFHNRSLGINVLTVKESLKKRFKPEQIARFGNTHVIYPSLSRNSYELIIKRKIIDIVELFFEKSGVYINVDQSVYDAIYRNGVFPAQGTRPLFSTIASFFENAMPEFILNALISNKKEILICYKNGNLLSEINDKEVIVASKGDIDEIKANNKEINFLTKNSVHEAGHAIAYAVLFGYSPLEITTLTASNNIGGFVNCCDYEQNKDYMLKIIQVCYAGKVAEEIIFGEKYANSTSQLDIEKATELSMHYLRSYGMGSKKCKQSNSSQIYYNTDLEHSNKNSDLILKEQYENAVRLIKSNYYALKDLSQYLIDFGKITGEKFVWLMKKHKIEVKQIDQKSHVIIPDYYEMFENWKNKVDA